MDCESWWYYVLIIFILGLFESVTTISSGEFASAFSCLRDFFHKKQFVVNELSNFIMQEKMIKLFLANNYVWEQWTI